MIHGLLDEFIEETRERLCREEELSKGNLY